MDAAEALPKELEGVAGGCGTIFQELASAQVHVRDAESRLEDSKSIFVAASKSIHKIRKNSTAVEVLKLRPQILEKSVAAGRANLCLTSCQLCHPTSRNVTNWVSVHCLTWISLDKPLLPTYN